MIKSNFLSKKRNNSFTKENGESLRVSFLPSSYNIISNQQTFKKEKNNPQETIYKNVQNESTQKLKEDIKHYCNSIASIKQTKLTFHTQSTIKDFKTNYDYLNGSISQTFFNNPQTSSSSFKSVNPLLCSDTNMDMLLFNEIFNNKTTTFDSNYREQFQNTPTILKTNSFTKHFTQSQDIEVKNFNNIISNSFTKKGQIREDGIIDFSSRPIQHTLRNLEYHKYFDNSYNKTNTHSVTLSTSISDHTIDKKPLIFSIQKIRNKSEYKQNSSLFDNKNIKNTPTSPYKISLKKIKQIFLENCLLLIGNYSKNDGIIETFDSVVSCQVSVIKKALNILRTKQGKHLPKDLTQSRNSGKRNHYYMFSSEAKKFCLDLLNKEKISLEVVAKMCNVPTKSLRRWSIVGCSRKKGCGRKIKDPIMEKKLLAWYLNCVNKENLYPTGKMIRAKALELTEIKGFLASKGWLEKFKKKYNVKTYTSKEKKVLLAGNQ